LRIDETALAVGMHEFDPRMLTDVEALEAFDDLAFSGWLRDAYPCSPLGGARHDGVEALADARQQRGRGFAHLALDLGCVVLLDRAVPGNRCKLSFRAGGRAPIE
jgi:hypothetical protein